MSRALLALPALLAAAIVAAVSCQDLPTGEGCFDIPAGGCPPDRGGTCDDPTCAALYDCLGGHWVLAQTCPTPDGGPGPDGGSGGPHPEAGTCTPVIVDAGPTTIDCTPDLAFPDCPFEAAKDCAESACLTGCSDFFVCTVDPGWVDVAYCDDQGQLVLFK